MSDNAYLNQFIVGSAQFLWWPLDSMTLWSLRGLPACFCSQLYYLVAITFKLFSLFCAFCVFSFNSFCCGCSCVRNRLVCLFDSLMLIFVQLLPECASFFTIADFFLRERDSIFVEFVMLLRKSTTFPEKST